MAGKSPLGKAREAPRISASLGGYLGGKDHQPSAMEEKHGKPGDFHGDENLMGATDMKCISSGSIRPGSRYSADAV